MSNLSVNAIRFLGIDVINKVKTQVTQGWLWGISLNGLYLFTNNFVSIQPNQTGLTGSAFILSAGHGSMLLMPFFTFLVLKIRMDEIKNFRHGVQKTPGHPELGHTAGVDAHNWSL